jgi:hypothetical protein
MLSNEGHEFILVLAAGPYVQQVALVAEGPIRRPEMGE